VKKYLYVTSLAAALLASAAIAAAQGDQNSPFTGTWKLNVAKSRFKPGPAPKSETVTIAQEGKVSVETVDAQDKTVDWSYTPSGDEAVPIEGMENSTVMSKTSGNTVEHTWKMNSQNSTGHGVVSKDGKRMTYTLTGTNAQGQHEHNVMIFEKE